MSTAEVISICQQLANEGKEPSVALIKARLTKVVPLPTVIAGFKSYKANPKQALPEVEQGTVQVADKTLEARVKQLEQELEELKVIVKKLQG